MAKAAIQRGVGVALWRQISDSIRRELGSGLADKTGRLPAEQQLAARFGVNRHTVRAAIAALVHEGVLQAEQGRGTYVRRRARLVYPIGARTRFGAGLEGQARERQVELLDSAVESAAHAAEALGLPENASLIRLETLGSADGFPVSRAASWFAAARYPDIADAVGRFGSVTAALAEAGTNDYLRAWTAIEARHADAGDVRDLKLSAGAIVLVTRALNVDVEGIAIQYSETRFPADRIELMAKA